MNTQKAAFSLTFVLYDEGNVFAWLMALLSLCPVFIFIFIFGLVVFEGSKMRKPNLAYCIGLLFNTGINLLLKQFFCYERPPTLEGLPFVKRSKCSGFPSNHSQFMAFFSVLFPFWLKEREKLLLPYTYHFLQIIIQIGCILVAVSRVYLGYHTFIQASSGYCVGLLTGLVYLYALMNFVRRYQSYGDPRRTDAWARHQ